MFSNERAVDSIEQAQQQSRTRFFWVVNYLSDYTDWDWLWEPVPWQAHQRHAWTSQWQKDSGTYLVPKAGYTDTNYHADKIITRTASSTNWNIPPGVVLDTFDWSWHPDPTEPPYIYQFGTQHQRTGGPQYCVTGAIDLKFVDQIRVETDRVATAVYEIDHMDGSAGQIHNTTKRVRYFDNYRDTLIRLAKSIGDEHEFVWVCSSICDYAGFDFSWHPEQWQATMLHVFASSGEKFGDTFFMHVPTFAARAENKALLEWYDCNFVNASVPRRSVPVITHNCDSQADAVRTMEFQGPLAVFSTGTTDDQGQCVPIIPLWRTETKTITPLCAGASVVVVPKTAVGNIRTQLYDYPYIDKTHKHNRTEQLLDIVFISNGENEAEPLYQHLVNCVGGNALVNGDYRIKRVQNVNGRVAAYHAAALASTTPWFFAVFAKLEVNIDFDWSWQPDRMQQAKHYIFHAMNPVNGLIYGHQAMIAYNKRLVLENTGQGLDFTLDQPHEVVPLLSGRANYYTNNWMCWRTAFRESLKLKASLPDVENEYRLSQWLTVDKSTEQWSRKGAEDAVEFYNAVAGDPVELKKSYEWNWLASYAFMTRALVAT